MINEGRLKTKRIIKREELNFQSDNKPLVIHCWSEYNLNPEQQQLVKENKDTVKDILKLTRIAFKDESLTKYGPEYNNVKRYYGKFARDKGGIIPLSDAQIEVVLNNAFAMKPKELAEMLFEDKYNDADFMRRAAATIGFLRGALNLEYEGPDADVLEDHDVYVPPSHSVDIVNRINKFASPQWEIGAGKKLSMDQVECVRLLKQWMGGPRFILTANLHKKRELRNLFEEEFIKAVYDKAESLTAEDVNNYISLANEYTRELVITEQVAIFENLAQSAAKGNDEQSRLFNKNISDSLKSVQTQQKACKDHIAKLSKELNGSLSKRKELAIKSSSSFAKMVNDLRDENMRAKLLRAAKGYNENVLKAEIDKMANHPEEIAQVWGVDSDEILGFSQDII